MKRTNSLALMKWQLTIWSHIMTTEVEKPISRTFFLWGGTSRCGVQQDLGVGPFDLWCHDAIVLNQPCKMFQQNGLHEY